MECENIATENLAKNLFNEESNDASSNKENNISKKRDFFTVDKLLHKANIDKTELQPLVQNIYFENKMANDDYKLIQVDNSMLDYLLEGKSLVIRGNESENAVLCSNSKTYSFKVAEVSNPMIFSKKIYFNDEIEKDKPRSLQKSEIFYMSSCYFALTPERPHIQKLKNTLEMNLYFGKSIENNNNGDIKKYKINDFLEIIQASEEEIYSYLNYIEAYQIDGYWRLLEFRFYNQIVDDILKCIDENSFSYSKVPIEDIYLDLQSIYELSILKQVINYFFTQDKADPKNYSLRKEKLLKFYSESLLRSTNKMNYNEFIQILYKTLPKELRSFEFKIEYIQNICYVEEPYIYYLNCIDLPDSIEKRFKILFEKRGKWPALELTAFISDLCNHDVTQINNMLTKFCRSHTQNGVKFFTSRI